MNRFKTSKYRHTSAKPDKKENGYSELNVSSQNSDSNLCAASRQLGAFVWETAGGAGSVGVFSLAKPGKLGRDMTVIAGHSAAVTDLAFDPFDDFAIATGSADNTVKYWHLTPEMVEAKEAPTTPVATLSGHTKAVQCVVFHPHAAGVLLSASADRTIRVWDVASGTEKYCLGGDSVYGDGLFWADWSDDGKMIVTTSKDLKIRLWDVRANKMVAEGKGHDGTKASRVLWLGETNKFVTTGFSKTRERQWFLWDASKLDAPLAKQSLGSGTGLLLPFFDIDTKLFMIGAKGEGNIRTYEILDKAPWVSEVGACPSSEPSRGMCMVPKQSCNIMGCEVARILKATKAALEPIGFIVPRQRMRDFQEDLFPNTRGGVATHGAAEWFGGADAVTQKIPLRPGASPLPMPERLGGAKAAAEAAAAASSAAAAAAAPAASAAAAAPTPDASYSSGPAKSGEPQQERPALVEDEGRDAVAIAKAVSAKIIRESKYRHISGKAWKKELNYDGIKIASAETTNLLKANPTFAAVPWTGAGGQLGVVPLDKPVRLSTDHPVIAGHSASVVDFAFDPFDDHVVATGSEDTHVKVWRIPAGGLTETMTEPLADLRGHQHKVTVVSYHPTAKGLLSTGSFDQTVRLWDVEAGQEASVLDGLHDDSLGDMAWHPINGSTLATSCKDTFVRVIDPRSKTVAHKTVAHQSVKASRVAWALGTDMLITTGASKSSMRQVALWDLRKFDSPVKMLDIDVGSGVLQPYFDRGTGILFLAGKGDGNTRTYEVVADNLHYLTEFRSNIPQMGVSFLPTTVCNVKAVEFARMIRLTKTHLETVEFKVPRTRAEFFQDDIFADTADLAAGAPLSAADFLAGTTKDIPTRSLCPDGMTPLSKAPKEVKKAPKYSSSGINQQTKDLPASRDELFGSFFQQVRANQDDDFKPDGADKEGVDEDEWD